MLKSILGATCACLAVVSFNVNSALVGRLAATPGGTDYQAYYDDVADLTWLADARVLSSDPYNGGLYGSDYYGSRSDVAGLNVEGVTGWRLPKTYQFDSVCNMQQPSLGFYCIGSEMGNLFYNVLGNTAGSLVNPGPFTNISTTYSYASTLVEFIEDEDEGTYYEGSAYHFNMGNGYLDIENIGYPCEFFSACHYAWAVHDGDVSAVPIPSAVWLFGSGLLGLVGVARRERNA